MKASVRYLKYILGIVIFVLLSIGTFNWFIDPFEIYWTGEFKPHRKVFMTKVWISKAMNVRKISPQSLLLGSSRSMIGLDAEHPGGDASVYPRYNFGVPASNLYEMLSYLEHSNELNPIKQAIVGLDFFSFNVFYKANSQFNDSFLLKEGESQQLSHFRETMISLFTLTAFNMSKKKMRSAGKENIFLNGSTTEFYKYTQKYPPGKSFLHNQKNYISVFLYPPPRYHFCMYDQNGENPQMKALKKIVNLANRKNIDLRIFIHPIHASLQQIIKYAGLWNEFEDWKKKLVQITSKQTLDQNQKIILWDFSGYNDFTTEDKTPLESLVPTMKWYWEAMHYNNKLGDRVLDRIYNYKDDSRNTPDDFGVVINKENIASHIQLVRKQQMKYELSHTKEKDIWFQRIEQIQVKRRSSDCYMGSGA